MVTQIGMFLVQLLPKKPHVQSKSTVLSELPVSLYCDLSDPDGFSQSHFLSVLH